VGGAVVAGIVGKGAVLGGALSREYPFWDRREYVIPRGVGELERGIWWGGGKFFEHSKAQEVWEGEI